MVRFIPIPAVALILATCPLFAAPPLDRRSRDEPEIVVNAGGRNGPCDTLQFSADGKSLLAAGDDKMVRIWRVSASGLDTDAENLSTLLWPAWREQRGGIKSIAQSPDGRKVAIGGYGMRPGTVAVVDRTRGDLLALTWPAARPGVDQFNAVMQTAFHPDGEIIAFGTADGSVFIWSPAKLPEPDAEGRQWTAPARVARHERLPAAFGHHDFNLPRALYFADRKTLISVAQSGQVITCDLSADYPTTAGEPPPANVLFDVCAKKQKLAVQVVSITSKRDWLAIGMVGPEVILRSTDGKQTISLPLRADEFPRAVAISPNADKLAVVVTAALPKVGDHPRFYMESNDRILIYDRPFDENRPKPTELTHRGPAEQIAWHPSDGRLAIAGGNSDEITLLNPSDAKGTASVARGAGRKLWGVALSEDGTRLAIQPGHDDTAIHPNRRANGERSGFHLARMLPLKPDAIKGSAWLKANDTADGWTVVPDEKDRTLWHVRNEAGERYPLPWNRAGEQAPTCFTFLSFTKDKPTTRLIVGHYYGASLYELTPAGPVRVKLYTGHAGETLAVCASADQSWFVTSGSDQTVCAWSLKDWPNEPTFGATVEVVDGDVRIAAVAIGSPAYEAGLSVGDTIKKLVVGGNRQPVYDRTVTQAVGTAEDVVASLRKPRPGVELYFAYKPKAEPKNRATLTTVRERPLWKWFPAFDDQNRMTDWVIWMWKGSFYHTESAHGDRLVGWTVNHPEIDGKPEFYQLNQFSEQYRRPEVIETILSTRSVQSALDVAWKGNQQRVSFNAHEPAPVRLAIANTVANKDGVKLNVIVERRGTNPDLLPETVELWINDFRYKTWKPEGQAVKEEIVIAPRSLRIGDNKLTVLTFNRAGGRAEKQEIVTRPGALTARQLVGLSIGVNDYGTHRKVSTDTRDILGDLASAVQDARDLKSRLDGFRGDGRCFGGSGLVLKLNAEASRNELLTALTALANGDHVNPDDHLIVFFAGHGVLLDPKKAPGVLTPGNGRGLSRKADGEFLFCCPDFSPFKPKDTALSANELFERLASINCRKTVLFDACQSGQATDANLIRRFIPHGQGPTVIAACDSNEKSYEHPDPKIGHGVFTLAMLEALGDKYGLADYNTDGMLTNEELYRYLADRVPKLASQVNKGDTQNPICFPRQPPRTLFVKK